MLRLNRLLSAVAGLSILTGGLSGAMAQDSTLPDLFLDVPESVITFDNRVSPLQGVGVLSQDAMNINASHRIAQQQVRLAIQYLQLHRKDILSGQNEQFNKHFGSFYGENEFGGQYEATREYVVLESNSTREVDLSRRPGLIVTNPLTIEEFDEGLTTFNYDFRTGDHIFVGDVATQTGQVVRVETVTQDPDGTNLILNLDPRTPLQVLTTTLTPTVRRVVKIEERPNQDHYEQVLSTFFTIRDALDEANEYRGEFDQLVYDRIFNSPLTQIGAGAGTFPGLDAVLGQPATRALRQAGYSNSDTQPHLDNLALRNDPRNTTTDTFGNLLPLPLLWTEDNDQRFDDNGNPLPDSERAFWNSVMTIFGDDFDSVLADTNIQYVGRAFLEETLINGKDFFNSDAPSDVKIDPITGLPVADSSEKTESSTALRQWQMIVQNAAEHGTIGMLGGAIVGLDAIQSQFFPEGSPQFLEGQAAGNFARFADIFKSLDKGGAVNPQMLEPIGRRAQADNFPVIRRFNPVVLDPLVP